MSLALRQITRVLPRSAGRYLSTDILGNAEQATGPEKKELQHSKDVFWSREPVVGPRGTIEKPALIPSFSDSRVVGLDTEAGVCYFRLDVGPPAFVNGQFFQLQKLSDGDAHH